MKKEKKMNPQTKHLIYIVGGIVLLILIVFSLGAFLVKDKNQVRYNDFLFSKAKNGFWNVRLYADTPQGKIAYNLETRFNPNELEYIPVTTSVLDTDILAFFKNNDGSAIDAVYLTFDPKLNESSAIALAASDVASRLRAMGISVEIACSKNFTDACFEKPIITCNSTYPVIYIKEAENEAVTYAPYHCIMIEGKGIGLIKSVERLLFTWYGIMY